MRIMEKIAQKSKDLINGDIPMIAFLGDSVTQGCFELITMEDGSVDSSYDPEYGYPRRTAKILATLYPNVPVTILNAGISGDNAIHGRARLQKDVLRYGPDLVVVCFGINDSFGGMDKLGDYVSAMDGIFSDIKNAGCECICLTGNMMNTYVGRDIKDSVARAVAADTMKLENEGILRAYFEAAKKTAGRYSIPVCDIYGKWRTLYESGVDTTSLLSNRINHPSRAMHWLTAGSLIETMLKN